jgi:hypothetical protein
MARGKQVAALLVDRLPLYATDAELGAAIMGKRAAEWPLVLRLWEARKTPKFPEVNKLTGGRFVPRVLEFLEKLEGLGDGGAEPANDFEREVETWNSIRRRSRRPG